MTSPSSRPNRNRSKTTPASERDSDMNLVTFLKKLGRRFAGQAAPPAQPPESTLRRTTLERERRLGFGARSIITLSIALLVAACGGGSAANPSSPGGSAGGNESGGDQPAASAPADALADEPEGAGGLCDLLPQASAEAALGEPVDGGTYKKSSISGTDICRYTATGSEHALQIEFKGDVSMADWEDAVGGAGMLDEQPIDGIGEVAYRSDNAVLGPGTRLVAFDHGTTIWVVMYTDHEPSAVFSAAESVAKDLLVALAS